MSSSTSEEDNTMCQEALTGEDDTECFKYKVTNKDLNECVHNENSAIGNTPCMEKLINCEDKKTEAKEEICDKLEVTDKNKEVCRMHSTEKNVN